MDNNNNNNNNNSGGRDNDGIGTDNGSIDSPYMTEIQSNESIDGSRTGRIL